MQPVRRQRGIAKSLLRNLHPAQETPPRYTVTNTRAANKTTHKPKSGPIIIQPVRSPIESATAYHLPESLFNHRRRPTPGQRPNPTHVVIPDNILTHHPPDRLTH